MTAATRSARPDQPPSERSQPRCPSPAAVDLVAVGRLIGQELPLLATIGLLLALVGSVVAAVSLAAPLLAPVVAALGFGPVWLGATAGCDRLLGGEPVEQRDLGRLIGRHAQTGIGLALLPATVATLLLGSLAILAARPEQRWMLLPIAVDVAALAVLAGGGIAVFPLAATTRLRGRRRWAVALALAGRAPMATAGIAAIAILIALSARHVAPFFGPIMAAPLCLLATAVTRAQVAATDPRGGGARANEPVSSRWRV